MNETVVQFKDKYGDTQTIHNTKNGWRKKRIPTDIILANRMIAPILGEKIKTRRLALGLTLKEAAMRCGLSEGNPKQRWYAFENATRGEGMRLGTLYRIAKMFGCEIGDILPTNSEVEKAMRDYKRRAAEAVNE